MVNLNTGSSPFIIKLFTKYTQYKAFNFHILKILKKAN